MTISQSFGSMRTRFALGIAASCAFAGAAVAGEPTIVLAPSGQAQMIQHQQVRYADLDLGSDAGRATLERRIRFAAGDVCDRGAVVDTQSAFSYLDCYSAALRNARAQVSERIAAAAGTPVAAAP